MAAKARGIAAASTPEAGPNQPGSGVDRRRREARRFEAVCAELAAEVGGSPSAAEAHVIRSAASLVLQSERLQEAQQRGEVVDSDELVRTANVAARLLSTLRAKRSRRAPLTGRMALEAHLRAKHGRADA